MMPLYATDFSSSNWHLVQLAILFALVVLAVAGGRWWPR